VGGFIIGLPLNMDDSEGPRVESVKHFAEITSFRHGTCWGFEPLIAFSRRTAHDAGGKGFFSRNKPISPANGATRLSTSSRRGLSWQARWK